MKNIAKTIKTGYRRLWEMVCNEAENPLKYSRAI